MLERHYFSQLAFWMPPEHCIDVLHAAFKKLCQKRSHLVEKINICKITIFDHEPFKKILNDMLASLQLCGGLWNIYTICHRRIKQVDSIL